MTTGSATVSDPLEDLSLKVVWSGTITTVPHESYTVTFDANGGQLPNGVPTSKTVINGMPYGELPTPTREGYTFKGWNGKNLFDGLFIAGAIPYGRDYTDINCIRNLNYSDLNALFYTFGGYFNAGTYTFSINSDDHWYSINRVAIAGTNSVGTQIHIRNSYTWTQNVDGYTYFSIERDGGDTNYTDTNFDGYNFKLQIEEGTTATPYEPYYITSDTEVVQNKNHTLKAIWEANS